MLTMNQEQPKQKINVVLDLLTHKRLRFESIERRESMSVIINETLENHFAANKEQSNDRK
jgi:hypothetical protein